MKEQRLDALWRKYGGFIILGSVAIVLATAGWTGWNHYAHSKAQAQTTLYLDAIDALDKNDAALAINKLEAITANEKTPFGGLVLLKKIQAYTQAGKADEAQKVQTLLAAQNHVYGDVANMLVKAVDDKEVSKDQPLYFARSEWRAWALLDAGKEQEACALFAALKENSDTPATMRERAKAAITHLGAEKHDQ
jgi:hypothetical protein